MNEKPENVVLKPETSQNQQVCSYHECVKCHYKWPPLTQIVKCPDAGGCQSPVLAIKLENCPICNEPVGKTRIRVDFTSQHIMVKPICAGASSTADSHYVDIERRIYEPEVQKSD